VKPPTRFTVSGNVLGTSGEDFVLLVKQSRNFLTAFVLGMLERCGEELGRWSCLAFSTSNHIGSLFITVLFAHPLADGFLFKFHLKQFIFAIVIDRVSSALQHDSSTTASISSSRLLFADKFAMLFVVR
jgi:hypothetical protein